MEPPRLNRCNLSTQGYMLDNVETYIPSTTINGEPRMDTPHMQQMEQQYADDIKNQTARIVSDGSYARGRSSAAFVTQHTQTQTPLREVDQKGYIHGEVTVPRHKDEQNSYRGELGEF